MLTTLSTPTGGTGKVAGHDIIKEPELVRQSMGLPGQHPVLATVLWSILFTMIFAPLAMVTFRRRSQD